MMITTISALCYICFFRSIFLSVGEQSEKRQVVHARTSGPALLSICASISAITVVYVCFARVALDWRPILQRSFPERHLPQSASVWFQRRSKRTLFSI